MADSPTSRLWNDEHVAHILERIADNVPVKRILKERPDLPSYQTVMRWRRENINGFSEMYYLAREDQADTAADEITQIADEVEGCTDSAVINAARLRIDARKWTASKLKPGQYGERIAQAIEGNINVSHESRLKDLE